MTTKQAIHLLHRLQDEQFDGEHGDERREALSMAVRALESNLVKGSDGLVNDLVNDCISRKMAIDALDKHIDTFDAIDTNYLCGLRTAMSTLKEMPSAQPDLDEWCTDCKEYDDKRHCCPRWNRVIRQALKDAQPERKKGKWIPVDSFSAFGGDEAMWMAHGNPVAFYYCSECKEQAYAGEDGESLLTDFCPSCGADMRVTPNELP